MIKSKDTSAKGIGDGMVAERGVASMARARSLQSRLSGALAVLLCAGLGLGLLIWYYAGMVAHRRAARAPEHGQTVAVAADSSLPPLGPIRDLLAAAPEGVSPSSAPSAVAEVSPIPAVVLSAEEPPLAAVASGTTTKAMSASTRPSALQRRLAGPAFAASSESTAALVSPPGIGAEVTVPAGVTAGAAGRGTALGELLTPTAISAAHASQLPTQQLLLAKGAFIDCTLETAIDSALPGMTTCITATDTFSVDGKVVLLERGSKLIGETRGQVQQGSARLFVLWTEARTPAGIVVPLASPGTDALGRSGLEGEVDRHFWQRFGAAILISMVDTAAQASQHAGGSGTVIYDTSSSQGVATEALRGTIGIAPTITKHQGDRIQILVARDLDFRQVYQLRESESSHQQ